MGEVVLMHDRFTTKEFDELCFEYGIELDEDVRESRTVLVL